MLGSHSADLDCKSPSKAKMAKKKTQLSSSFIYNHYIATARKLADWKKLLSKDSFKELPMSNDLPNMMRENMTVCEATSM